MVHLRKRFYESQAARRCACGITIPWAFVLLQFIAVPCVWGQQRTVTALAENWYIKQPESDKPGKIAIDIGQAFELPPRAAQQYSVKSPWKEDTDKVAIVLSVNKEHTFELAPFEVQVFDALPLSH